MVHLSVNKLALEIVKKVSKNKEKLKVTESTLSNGATVLDFSKGSYKAGKYLAEICLGGLGDVKFTSYTFDNYYLPAVQINSSEPIIACMASQFAGWSVKLKKEVEKDGGIKKKKIFDSLGSGPARALSRVEKELYEELGYKDDADCAVLVFETSKLPNEEVMELVASKCGVSPNNTYACCAPTACLCGSIQVAARIVETGIHKLHELHFPLDIIKTGFGTTTIAPIAKDDLNAMGVTNDSLIATGSVYYTIEAEKEKQESLWELIRKAPAHTSASYGKPFIETFKEVNYSFYDIDPGLFAPALYTVNNLKTGKTITAGLLNNELLKMSYGLS
jgi:methenyltetrahydromethanopterin cyclohydrolase